MFCIGPGVYSIAMGDGVNMVGIGVDWIGLMVGSDRNVFEIKSDSLYLKVSMEREREASTSCFSLLNWVQLHTRQATRP